MGKGKKETREKVRDGGESEKEEEERRVERWMENRTENYLCKEIFLFFLLSQQFKNNYMHANKKKNPKNF